MMEDVAGFLVSMLFRRSSNRGTRYKWTKWLVRDAWSDCSWTRNARKSIKPSKDSYCSLESKRLWATKSAQLIPVGSVSLAMRKCSYSLLVRTKMTNFSSEKGRVWNSKFTDTWKLLRLFKKKLKMKDSKQTVENKTGTPKTHSQKMTHGYVLQGKTGQNELHSVMN